MRGGIKLNSGVTYDINEIENIMPLALVRCNLEHIDVGEFISKKIINDYSELHRQVFVNLILQRSKKVKLITSIILLSKKEKIKSIDISFLGKDFCELFDYPINFSYKYSNLENLIDFKERWKGYFKIIPNYFFRLFIKKSIPHPTTIVRAWVDVDEKLHSKVFSKSLIYIYPFGLNLLRSFKFIRRCFNNYESVTLMGVPYRLKDLIKLFFAPKSFKDIAFMLYEFNAHKNHSEDFEDISNIYTSDEYNPAVLALYNSIHKKIKTVNIAHGIGFYNAYINYTEFRLFNENQKLFYQKLNKNIKYHINFRSNKINNNLAKTFDNFIYIDQGDLLGLGYPYEDNLQMCVLDVLSKLSITCSNKFYIKFHPNRTNKSINQILSKYNNIIRTNDILMVQDSALLINLYSTIYFDYFNTHQMLFISDKYFTPKILFGEEISIVDLSLLEINILKLKR